MSFKGVGLDEDNGSPVSTQELLGGGRSDAVSEGECGSNPLPNLPGGGGSTVSFSSRTVYNGAIDVANCSFISVTGQGGVADDLETLDNMEEDQLITLYGADADEPVTLIGSSTLLLNSAIISDGVPSFILKPRQCITLIKKPDGKVYEVNRSATNETFESIGFNEATLYPSRYMVFGENAWLLPTFNKNGPYLYFNAQQDGVRLESIGSNANTVYLGLDLGGELDPHSIKLGGWLVILAEQLETVTTPSAYYRMANCNADGVDINDYGSIHGSIFNSGVINSWYPPVTISSGEITFSTSSVVLKGEGNVADDLVSIVFDPPPATDADQPQGTTITLWKNPHPDCGVITVKNSGNMITSTGEDLVIDDTTVGYSFEYRKTANGVYKWVQMSGVSSVLSTVEDVTDQTCFPLFINDSGSQVMQPKNNPSFTYDALNNILGVRLNVLAGNSSISPMVMNSGSLLGSAVAGAWGYDGVGLAFVNNTVVGHEAVFSGAQLLNSAYGPSANNTYFYFFDSSGASGKDIPLTTGVYYIEYELNFTVNNAATTVNILFTRGNSSGSWRVSADASPITGASGATATINGSRLSADCIAGGSSTVTLTTGSLSSGVSHRVFVRMICQATSSSDYITCQMRANTVGTATITTLANSYWMARRFRSIGENY